MDDVILSMSAIRKQQTLAKAAPPVEGFGYWSGRDVRVEFRPAEVDTGIVFVRGDLPRCPRIPARIENRAEMPLRTSLCHDGAGVEMVEHILAVLAGLRIDNCEVWVDESEMPGCDGSALPFLDAVLAAGVVIQDAPRQRKVLRETVRLGGADTWIEARTAPTGLPTLRYDLDYGLVSSIGSQTFQVELSPETFRKELAPCRTFMLKSEADRLLAQGLGRRVTPRDLLVYDDKGPIGNALRFPNECVRHKLMDLVGDLALAGCDLVGSFHACRSGHRLNAEMVRTLLGRGTSVAEWKRCA